MTRVVLICVAAVGLFAVCKKDAPPAAPTPRAEERRVEAARPAVEPARTEPAAAVNVPTPSAGAPAAPAAEPARTGSPRGSKAKGDGVKTCPVSGEEIGSGGMKPAEIDYKGRKVRFCCKSCIKDFMKDPEAYLKN